MITLGLVDSVDDNGVYVVMPGSRGVLRGPYKSLSTVAAGTTALINETDDGEVVVVGPAAGGDGVYNVRSFGAVGDGVTDDTDAVRAAFEAASARRVLASGVGYRPGGTVVIPRGVYHLASLDTPIVASCNVDGSQGQLRVPAAYDDVALLVGHEESGKILHGAEVVCPDVVKNFGDVTSMVAGSVGVRVQNLYTSRVKCGRIWCFETGLHVTGLGIGSAYNEVSLGYILYCKIGLMLKPLTGGWANSNTFISGEIANYANTFDGFSSGDVYRTGYRHIVLDGAGINTVDCNSFVGVSCEGALSEYTVELVDADQNTFSGVRLETSNTSYTVTASGDTFTRTAHGLEEGDALRIGASTTVPAGVVADIVYVVDVPTADTFKVSEMRGGAPLDSLTSGTDVIYWRLPVVVFDDANRNTFTDYMSFPGPVAELRENDSKYNFLQPSAGRQSHEPQGAHPPGRNRIINGDFRVNQREYSSGAYARLTAPYTFDRWKVTTDYTSLTFAASPHGQPVLVNSSHSLMQVVERANVEAGTYTLSWRGTCLGRIYNESDTPPSFDYSPITVDLDGSENVCVEFYAYPDASLFEVQLERGSKPTPFERVPISEAMTQCRRYYIQYGNAAGVNESVGIAAATSTTSARCHVGFPVPMRTAPTVDEVNASLRITDSTGSHYLSGSTTGTMTENSANLTLTSTGLTAGAAGIFETGGSAGSIITFDAEL